MKTKAISSIFVLFAIAAGIVSMAPAAFADHPEVAITTVEESGFSQGCVESGCYTPVSATSGWSAKAAGAIEAIPAAIANSTKIELIALVFIIDF